MVRINKNTRETLKNYRKAPEFKDAPPPSKQTKLRESFAEAYGPYVDNRPCEIQRVSEDSLKIYVRSDNDTARCADMLIDLRSVSGKQDLVQFVEMAAGLLCLYLHETNDSNRSLSDFRPELHDELRRVLREPIS